MPKYWKGWFTFTFFYTTDICVFTLTIPILFLTMHLIKWNEREIQIKNPTNVNQHSSMPFTLMCTWKWICYFTHLNKIEFGAHVLRKKLLYNMILKVGGAFFAHYLGRYDAFEQLNNMILQFYNEKQPILGLCGV